MDLSRSDPVSASKCAVKRSIVASVGTLNESGEKRRNTFFLLAPLREECLRDVAIPEECLRTEQPTSDPSGLRLFYENCELKKSVHAV